MVVLAKSYEQLIRENIDNIREWRVEGFSVRQIADKLGVKPNTIYLYLRIIPELADAWEVANVKLVKDVLEPAILKLALEGLQYKEVTKERLEVIKPDGSVVFEMVPTKEIHKRNFSPMLIKYVLSCLDPKKWGGAVLETKDENKLSLDPGISSYGV